MNNVTTITGDRGYTQYREQGFSTGDTIDASDATWIVSNMGDDVNRYPFLIEDSDPGLTIIGGTIDGEIPLDMAWRDAYINSSGVLVRDFEDGEMSGWEISQAWDGIRLNGDSQNFTIEEAYMTKIRDDAIENDDGSGGVIKNSLFDGVFSGISVADEGTPSSASDNTVVIDGVLMRMESYLYKGEQTHFSPLKIEDSSPSVEIRNSVFAIEKPDHNGLWRQEIGWEKMEVSENNFFLNLSDEPFPKDYPLPGEGWTILQGQEARDFWESSRDDWIREFGDNGTASEPSAPDLVAAQESDTSDSDDPAQDDDVVLASGSPPSPGAAEAPGAEPVTEPVAEEDDDDGNFLSGLFDWILSIFGRDSDDDDDDDVSPADIATVGFESLEAEELYDSLAVADSETCLDDQKLLEMDEDECDDLLEDTLV